MKMVLKNKNKEHFTNIIQTYQVMMLEILKT